jgi:prepilin-type processing-associated H-X9-DG protein
MQTVLRIADLERRSRSAFSKGELLVVTLAFGILTCLLVTALRPTKAVRSAISCQNKLLQIGLAFNDFANDHQQQFPMSVPSEKGGTLGTSSNGYAYQHFQILSNRLGPPHYLICPQDDRKAAATWQDLANVNVSYVVGLSADLSAPDSILAGDRNLSARSNCIISLSTVTKWLESASLHKSDGNVLFADNHVERLDSGGLSNAVQRASNRTNRVAVP